MTNLQRERFERSWLPVALLIVALGLALHDPLALISGLALVAVGSIAAGWRAGAPRALHYRRSIEPSHLFPGERAALTVTLENRKLLPLAWLSVTERLPWGLRPADAEERDRAPRERSWRQGYTIGPWQALERRLTLVATRRGHYRLPPVAFESGDPFGLFRCEGILGNVDEVVVYPAFLAPYAWAPPAARPFGAGSAVPPAPDDPLLVSGVRPYAPGDAQRRIHWRATARAGALRSRRYDRSADLQMVIALDCRTSAHSWEGVDRSLLELLISLGATAARDALDARVPVGVLANAMVAGSDQLLRLSPSRAPDQLRTILEALAGIVPFFGPSLADVLEQRMPWVPFGTSLLVVTAVADDDLDVVLGRYRRRGQPVVRLDPRVLRVT